jgi:diadenosine tetraphosphate (Ap4A) HIT family hydrolase
MHRFALHPRLEADTLFVGDWALSRVLLMNDARFPWLILVPRRADIIELYELAHAERMVLIEEIARASHGLKNITNAAKINVGTLGNLVHQLHVHVVARRHDDPAWPGPVWGHGTPEPYASAASVILLERLRECLSREVPMPICRSRCRAAKVGAS